MGRSASKLCTTPFNRTSLPTCQSWCLAAIIKCEVWLYRQHADKIHNKTLCSKYLLGFLVLRYWIYTTFKWLPALTNQVPLHCGKDLHMYIFSLVLLFLFTNKVFIQWLEFCPLFIQGLEVLLQNPWKWDTGQMSCTSHSKQVRWTIFNKVNRTT